MPGTPVSNLITINSTMALSENVIGEDVIKRRLLIDGDGMGDERKLNALIKSYLAFADGEEAEDFDVHLKYRQLNSSIKQMEHIARRTVTSVSINEEAQEIFVTLQEQVQSEIEQVKEQIDLSKVLLDEATKHRKYSMEYDALAKLIESKPDRKLTDLKKMGLELELDTLTRRQAKIDDKLDYRKATASMMGSTIQRLKELLAQDENGNGKPPVKPVVVPNGELEVEPIVMEVDSAGQSDPPTPSEPTQAVVVAVVPNGEQKNVPGPPSGLSSPLDKSKSEKYDDLSESEGDEHCENS